VAEGTRTPDIQSHSLTPENRKHKSRKQVTEAELQSLAQSLARQAQFDPDLALLIERWLSLPKPMRDGMAAMVRELLKKG